IGIARTAGLKLREMLKAGSVRVWFRANVENGWRPVQVTVGEIAGRTDDFVVVGGHQDSWPGPQATDNAAGNACILELARVFQDNWDQLREHAVAYVQIDQPACAGTTRWSSASNAELRRFHQGVEKRILGNR